jgi:hypothetical protein
MPIEAGSETLDMSCSDGDGKDCPVESLAFILTAADNRLGSVTRKTVDLSEWALIEQTYLVGSGDKRPWQCHKLCNEGLEFHRKAKL